MSLTNEYIRRKWGDRPQIDLAKAIAEKRGEKNYNSYKGYVNKWFKTDQESGKDYLLLLSEILNVSVESILRGEDIVTEYGDRPTAYIAAKSGDERIIERLFGNKEAEICLNDKDEYAKTFVDYVIEFNNYQAFKIAINKGYNYPTKWGEYLVLNPQGSEVDLKLTRMIVESDDLEMFKKALGRLFFNIESPHAVYSKNNIPAEITTSILKSHNILEWLKQIRPLTENEWGALNHKQKIEVKLNPEDDYVWEIPSMSYGYSTLIDCAVAENLSDILELLLDHALNYTKQLKTFLENHIFDFESDLYDPYTENNLEHILCFKKERRKKCWCVVPYVQNCLNISNMFLRKKAQEINCFFDTLR